MVIRRWPGANEAMKEFKNLPFELFIGYDVEQNSRLIALNVSEMIERYPSGTLQLICRRPGEETTYIAPSFKLDGRTLYWTPTSYDVEKAGQGDVIVVLIETSGEDVKVLASHKIKTKIIESLHFREADAVTPEDSLIARIQEKYDQVIADIEAKGAETLSSIPNNYTPVERITNTELEEELV